MYVIRKSLTYGEHHTSGLRVLTMVLILNRKASPNECFLAESLLDFAVSIKYSLYGLETAVLSGIIQ